MIWAMAHSSAIYHLQGLSYGSQMSALLPNVAPNFAYSDTVWHGLSQFHGLL
jgi:hypothetical protein